MAASDTLNDYELHVINTVVHGMRDLRFERIAGEVVHIEDYRDRDEIKDAIDQMAPDIEELARRTGVSPAEVLDRALRELEKHLEHGDDFASPANDDNEPEPLMMKTA